MAEDSRTGITAGLAVGLASAAVLGVGVLFLYLLFRKDQQAQTHALAYPHPYPQFGLGYPQVPAQAALPSGQTPVPVVQVAPKISGSGPTMTTVTVSKRSPAFLASASSVPVRATIRPVGPVAGFVCLGYSAGALQGDDFQGNGALIPVGQEQVVRLLPGQRLYARAVVPPSESVALVSVMRADAPGDV